MAWYSWWLQGSPRTWATSIPLALCPSSPLAPPALFHISLLQHFQFWTDFPGLQIALFFPLSNLSLHHLSQFLCVGIPHCIQTVMIFLSTYLHTPGLAGTMSSVYSHARQNRICFNSLCFKKSFLESLCNCLLLAYADAWFRECI